MTRSCEGCQQMKRNPTLTPLHPWEFPGGPWRRIHLDFAGPIEGKILLVIVDAYSKWPEVVVMEEVTAERTVEELRNTLARWGLPLQIVTDNGPQFISETFRRFMKLNNIKHITTSPYHPATNGLAERFVQTLKQSLRVSKKEDRTLQHRVATFLINYRNARHSITEESPAQLMIGRELRSRLHLLKPNLKDTVMKAQTAQVQRRTATPDRTFEIEEWVMVRDYRRAAKEKWQQAVVKTKLGCKTYLVEMRGGGVWKRHVDQMIKDHGSVLTERETTELDPEEEMTGEETNGWGPQIKEGRSVQQAPTERIQTPTLDVPLKQPEEDPMISQDDKPNSVVVSQTLETPPLNLEPVKTNPPENPRVVMTRSGRIVKKPVRYRED